MITHSIIVTSPNNDLEEALKDVPYGSGFRVVNFLKFHPVAIYPSDYEGPSVTGEYAYWTLYIGGVAPIVGAAGGSLKHRSKAYGTIAGLPGEEWDEVAIFEWPNVQTMTSLAKHPKVIELSVHRIAATKNLRMVPMAIQLDGN
ncbi:hypothetical protein [Rhodobium gokarnense]|uniref:DUF1330 domain-containing protein n=1 Tax=Rhodobium gokarnense TaxID=364296 RepID=A0ABT3H8K3_9HYPH|nr:hypothetical protein [Rhodobium gokarnense]MCW2306711.1 hypothetical protein [Rhodobium gokarnense]